MSSLNKASVDVMTCSLKPAAYSAMSSVTAITGLKNVSSPVRLVNDRRIVTLEIASSVNLLTTLRYSRIIQ